ncbi:MAG: hypothetical protein CML48_01410 [Rhodobacteraceae bacterium]|nr:hypothetical protein [Paracoccaceae bacterium]|tara:strand:- start:64 stop:372 length:309 start_codon:yes stop_codon:yes gene_type:complete
MNLIKSIYLLLSSLALVFVAKLDSYGIYLLLALFWSFCAFYKPLTKFAIWSIIIFMAGFALMRTFRILTVGGSDINSLAILISEILIALIGFWLVTYKRSPY